MCLQDDGKESPERERIEVSYWPRFLKKEAEDGTRSRMSLRNKNPACETDGKETRVNTSVDELADGRSAKMRLLR